MIELTFIRKISTNSCRNSPKRSRSSALGRPQQQRTKSKEPRAGSGHSLSYGRGDLPKPARANIIGSPGLRIAGLFRVSGSPARRPETPHKIFPGFVSARCLHYLCLRINGPDDRSVVSAATHRSCGRGGSGVTFVRIAHGRFRTDRCGPAAGDVSRTGGDRNTEL